MTRSEYMANSAKLLLLCSLMLLVANVLTIFGEPGTQIADIGSKLSTVSFYVVFFLSFIAFNGEGIGHKRKRSFRRKKVTTLLKLVALFPFLYRYVKAYVIKFVLSNADVGLGKGENIILAVLNTLASYSFMLVVVSLWYMYRDSQTKGLFVVEVLSFLAGLGYSIYKVFYYSVTYIVEYIKGYNPFGYDIEKLIRLLETPFANSDTFHMLCIVQYSANILMFLVAAVHYSKIADSEREEHQQAQKLLVPTVNIYNTDCVGIDTLDDDFAK